MKITAIGEILFDVYPDYKKLGGAPFNFLHHIWKLTGNGSLISRIGDDKEGKEIIKKLEAKKFDPSYIQLDPDHPTGIVNVKLNKKKVPEFDIVEDRAYDYIEYNSGLEQLVKKSDLFYFGSLAQRNEKSKNTIERLSEAAKKNFCDLNIRQEYYNKEIIKNSLERSNVVKLNSDELRLVNKFLFKMDFELEATAKEVLEKYNIDLLCITLGENGAMLFKGKKVSHYKEEASNIVDTVGAGDAYAALLAIGYLSKWKLEKINELASKFSAAICEVKGAIPQNDRLYNIFREKIKNGR